MSRRKRHSFPLPFLLTSLLLVLMMGCAGRRTRSIRQNYVHRHFRELIPVFGLPDLVVDHDEAHPNFVEGGMDFIWLPPNHKPDLSARLADSSQVARFEETVAVNSRPKVSELSFDEKLEIRNGVRVAVNSVGIVVEYEKYPDYFAPPGRLPEDEEWYPSRR